MIRSFKEKILQSVCYSYSVLVAAVSIVVVVAATVVAAIVVVLVTAAIVVVVVAAAAVVGIVRLRTEATEFVSFLFPYFT